jgi:hypothetical protein
MKFDRILMSCACALLIAAPAAFAAQRCECVAGNAAAEPHTRNVQQEANQLIQRIQDEASRAAVHATKLQSYADSPDLSWETHAAQLSALKYEIDNMGQDLCRLEAIRNAAAPWQQQTIKSIEKDVVLMADNADDAINYVSSHQRYLWNPAYLKYTNNLASLSTNLQTTTGRAVEFSRVRAKDRELRQDLKTSSSS